MTIPVNIGVIKMLLSIYELLVGRAKNMAAVLQMESTICCTGRPGISNCCITVNAAGLRLVVSVLMVAVVGFELRVSVWGFGAINTPLQ